MVNALLPFGRLEAMLDGMMAPAWRLPDGDARALVSPRADILEGDKAYRIEMEMPGVAREDLSIELEDTTLTVTARRGAVVPEGFKALHNERAEQVEYQRSFTLGHGIDPTRIEANLERGVLSVTLAKSEQALPRKIEVK